MKIHSRQHMPEPNTIPLSALRENERKENNMRYPKHLPEHGTIGFLAPSFGCNTEPYYSAFRHAAEIFHGLGYRMVFGPNCYAGEGVGISNTPEKCGREVMDSFLSRESDCLISCGGGELMCEILPHVDFAELAAADPKWFMGYSDNTNLTFLLATLADTASVYGPCAQTFGMEPWHTSLHDAFGILTGKNLQNCLVTVAGYDLWEKESLKSPENPLAPYHVTQPRKIRCFQGRKETSSPPGFHGRLLGGCLDCLVNLTGTRFDKTAEFARRYQEDGIIWFLEACDLNVFSIRRALWQMKEAGWLEHAKGFLIGRPANGTPMMNLDAYDAVLETAGRSHVPVIMDVDLGHLPPMMPLITGSLAQVSVRGNDISVEMRLVP